MFIVRFLVNAVIMASEVAAVAAVAWFGYRFPLWFALATAALALGLGGRLEYLRLMNEVPFYFGVALPKSRTLLAIVAAGEATSRAMLAGVVALLTFSGTDQARLAYQAVVFGVCVYVAAQVLRWFAHGLGAKPARWGFFRLAAPFGLLFSLGLTSLTVLGLVAAPGLVEIGRKAILETAANPSFAQASELLYVFKQWFDETIVRLLTVFLGPNPARVIGVFLSVNVLSGFVVAVYAVVISGITLAAEDRMLD